MNRSDALTILHVIPAIGRGGAENHLVDLIQQQRQRGHHPVVASLKNEAYWEAFLANLGVKVHYLGLQFYPDPVPIVRLRRLLQSIKPDIVHAHLPPAELYSRWALVGLSTQLPLVISKHNDRSFYAGIGQAQVGRWVAQRAQQMIAISEAVRQNVCLYQLHCLPEQVSTIYYGLDPTPYQTVDNGPVTAVRQSWGVTPSTYLIGVVARLIPQKALHTVLTAFQRYLAQATVPTQLVVVGRGALEFQLRQLADQLQISQQVIWAGFREDMPVVMNAIDVLALSSRYEGLGLVFLEAMAAAKPCVAPRVSAIPEVVEDGVTGILVPPDAPAVMADAFLALSDPALRARYGQAGYEKVSNRFTLERMAEQTLSIYRSCIP